MNIEEVKVLVAYRMEQADSSLDDAKTLIEKERSAMSIINRSYYAMFYAALALLQTLGQTPSKHTGVLSLFDQEFVLKGILSRDLGRNFHRAFTQRQLADYHGTTPPTREAAVELWHQAQEFVQMVNNYLVEQKWI